MDFTPEQHDKYRERTMGYAEHLQRSESQRFTPLTKEQYDALCKKIESSLR